MNRRSLGRLAGLLCLSLIGATGIGLNNPAGAGRPKCERGEFGGDLAFLRRYYSPPRAPGESNHYFDLWNGTTLPLLAPANGLTNNRTLFIDSHGRGEISFLRRRYVYYPHRSLLTRDQKPPRFSARDLAAVVGAAASGIHNIMIGGCNAEGAFDPQELRKYFVNATNIVHAPAGEDSFKPMFYSAIVNPSWQNQPLYAVRGKNRDGQVAYCLNEWPAPSAITVNPYITCLFRPGETEPYRTQVAGRELIDPAFPEPKSARSKPPAQAANAASGDPGNERSRPDAN